MEKTGKCNDFVLILPMYMCINVAVYVVCTCR